MSITRGRAALAASLGALLCCGLITPPAGAITVRTPWNAPASATAHPQMPSTVVWPGGALAAWVNVNGAGNGDAVSVCRMPAGGASCSSTVLLKYPPALSTPYYLDANYPAITRYPSLNGHTVKVAATGAYGPNLREVVIWTSLDDGVTFGPPVERQVAPDNSRGLAFSSDANHDLVVWQSGGSVSTPGAGVTVLDSNGSQACFGCGHVTLDASFTLNTPGGGVAGLANGDLLAVAERFSGVQSSVRVWRLPAGQDPTVIANWATVTTLANESLGTLRREGLVVVGSKVALLTEAPASGFQVKFKVRSWNGSAFGAPYVGLAGSTNPVVGLLPSGSAHLFSLGTNGVTGQRVTPSAGTPFSILAGPAIGSLYQYPSVALGGAGYGIYATTVWGGGSTNYKVRFVPLRVPHSLVVSAAPSATPHRYALSIREPAASETPTTIVVRTVVGGVVKAVATYGLAPGSTKKISVQPTAKTTYRVTAVAGAWWSSTTRSVTLIPR